MLYKNLNKFSNDIINFLKEYDKSFDGYKVIIVDNIEKAKDIINNYINKENYNDEILEFIKSYDPSKAFSQFLDKESKIIYIFPSIASILDTLSDFINYSDIDLNNEEVWLNSLDYRLLLHNIINKIGYAYFKIKNPDRKKYITIKDYIHIWQEIISEAFTTIIYSLKINHDDLKEILSNILLNINYYIEEINNLKSKYKIKDIDCIFKNIKSLKEFGDKIYNFLNLINILNGYDLGLSILINSSKYHKNIDIKYLLELLEKLSKDPEKYEEMNIKREMIISLYSIFKKNKEEIILYRSLKDVFRDEDFLYKNIKKYLNILF